MKKNFTLIIFVILSKISFAQNTITTNKLIVKTELTLAQKKIYGFQSDTFFNNHFYLPTSLAVKKYVDNRFSNAINYCNNYATNYTNNHLFNVDTLSNYIPYNGTLFGKKMRGNFLINNQATNFTQLTDANRKNEILFDAYNNVLRLSNSHNALNNYGAINIADDVVSVIKDSTQLVNYGDRIEIDAPPSSQGITGNLDYSSHYLPNSYVQKKYVDTHAGFDSMRVINGIVEARIAGIFKPQFALPTASTGISTLPTISQILKGGSTFVYDTLLNGYFENTKYNVGNIQHSIYDQNGNNRTSLLSHDELLLFNQNTNNSIYNTYLKFSADYINFKDAYEKQTYIRASQPNGNTSDIDIELPATTGTLLTNNGTTDGRELNGTYKIAAAGNQGTLVFKYEIPDLSGNNCNINNEFKIDVNEIHTRVGDCNTYSNAAHINTSHYFNNASPTGYSLVEIGNTDNTGRTIRIYDSREYSRGISSDVDFTPNITELDYVQKKYVDAKKPYKVYTALLKQKGTDDPTWIELQNEIGVLEWHRNDVGEYFVNDANGNNPFTKDKTTINFSTSQAAGGPYMYAQDEQNNNENKIYIYTHKAGGGLIDDVLICSVEIRVYN